ncbi:MAG: repeat protein [Gemmatimonadetes bacterium]|nr:repeat protein [Gemmatimonadota bacterium]
MAECPPVPAPPARDPGAGRAADFTRLAPVVSVAPHNPSIRDATEGTATLGYSTPAYVTLGQGRSVALVYSSGQAAPMAYVQVEATDNSTDVPATMSILVKNAQGAVVVGEVFYAAGNGATRLAAGWDASTLATGVYTYTLVVRTYWSDGTYNEASPVAARVLVSNHRSSPFGAGWSIAGMPRIQNTQSGDYVVLEEAGVLEYFAFTHCTPDASGGQVCYSDAPAGDFSALTYSYATSTYIRQFPDGGRDVFYSDGRLQYREDRFGNRTTFGWTTVSGTLVPSTVTDPVGKMTTFAYTSGHLASITDPAGRVSSFAVNAAGDLTNVQSPALGSDAVVAQYDAQHRMSQYWDRNSALTSFYYDVNGLTSAHQLAPVMLAGQTSPTRPSWYFTQQLSRVLPASGKGTQANPGDRRQPADVYASITDPRGNVSTVVADRFGLPVKSVNPLGAVTVIERNDSGQMVRTVAPSGHAVRYTWSGVELTKVKDETTGDSVRYEYEHTFHQPTHVVHGTSEVWNYYGGTAGVLDSTKVAGQPATRFNYDARGRVESSIDGEQHATYYTYADPDATHPTLLGNLSVASSGTVSTTSRRITRYVYDAVGRDSLTISPANDTTWAIYDKLNRTLTVTDPLHNFTTYGYGQLDLATVTDPKGQVYTFNRNALGWMDSEVDPRGKSISYAYDAAGNPSTIVNRRGQSITFTYDALNRPLTRTADGVQTTLTYDPGERWMTAANAQASDRVDYDVAGRITQSATTRAGTAYTVASAYAATGYRNRMDATGPWTGTKTVRYHLDAKMQMDTLVDFAGGQTTFEYNGDGAETFRVLPNGMSVTRGYPSTHLASEITYSSANDAKLSVGYSQDSRGLVSARVNSARDSVTSYGYDRLARLTSISFDKVQNATGTNCPGGALRSPDGGICTPAGGVKINQWLDSYTWDAVGNPTNHGAAVGNGNRLTQFNGFNLEYDDDGNLTRKYNTSTGFDQYFTWNSMGQLTGVGRTGVGWVTYDYDPFGRLARRVDQNTGATVQYIWDGDNLLFERDQAGTLTEYTSYPGIDEPHSLKRGSSIYYYAVDNVGNVTGLVDAAKTLVDQYQYEPFGQRIYSNETVANPLGFQGRQLDAATGLYSFRARWYDPQLQRFISEDPIGLDGGINVYAFANDNPVNFTDPHGLQAGCTDWYRVLVNNKTGEIVSEEYLNTTCPRGGGNGKQAQDHKHCPVVPEAPNGVDINENITFAEHYSGYSSADRREILTNLVEYGHIWDYKRVGSHYEPFGNFNYGAVAAAMGFLDQTSLRAAGYKQEQHGSSRPDWGHWWGSAPYGDEPRDQGNIRAGIQYYRNGCAKI